ncbi:hypothetical protein MMC10_006639 [Thelotrema lepadinum]|nr:hypothetical protein [Thelotrema lepadinum]
MEAQAAYVNFSDEAYSKKGYERAYYGDNQEELQRVKKIWDKDNFLKWTQGVRLPHSDELGAESDEERLTDYYAGKRWESYKLPTTDLEQTSSDLASE